MFAQHIFNEMNNFQREMDRFFGSRQIHRGLSAGDRAEFRVQQDADGYVVVAALPGLDQEKLDISVLGKQLTVRGEINAPELPEGARWVRQERRSGHFERTFRLPHDLDTDRIEAQYDRGILTINLPKAEAAKPKKIALKVA